MEKLLSIIVPTYNMEQCLESNLNSLIIEDSLLQYLEVLVINDGSKDSSLEIAKDFERRFPGVFFAIDKENGNYGSCINVGLHLAKGVYVKVLDADDSFVTENLASVVETISNNINENIIPDVILTDYQSINSELQVTSNLSFDFQENTVLNFENINRDELLVKLCHHVLFYKRTVLEEIDYVQSEGVSYSDVEWFIIPFTAVNTVYYIHKTVYLYLIGRDGQTVSPAKIKKGLKDHCIVAEKLLKSFSTLPFRSEINKQFVYDRIYTFIKSCFAMFGVIYFDKNNIDQLMDLDTFIKQNNISMYNDLDKELWSWKVPFKYIHSFRRNPRNCLFVNFVKVYQLFHRV